MMNEKVAKAIAIGGMGLLSAYFLFHYAHTAPPEPPTEDEDPVYNGIYDGEIDL